MRLALAIGVISVTLAAAVYVHERLVTPFSCGTPTFGLTCPANDEVAGIPYRPSWKNPVAVLLAIGGIAVAVGIASLPGAVPVRLRVS